MQRSRAQPGHRTIARLVRSVQRWWVSALLAAGLVTNSYCVVGDLPDRGAAGPGWLSQTLAIPPRLGGPLTYADLYVVRTPGAPLQLVDTDRDSTNLIGELWTGQPERVTQVSAEVSVGRSGVWGLTHESRAVRITVDPFVRGAFSADELGAARALVADHLAARLELWLSREQWRELMAAARSHDVRDDGRILWRGWLLDASFVLALVCFVVSLGWVPRLVGGVRARVGRQRLARGRCPECNYDLSGSDADRCPECGATPGGFDHQT